jgi:hypothetical protein
MGRELRIRCQGNNERLTLIRRKAPCIVNAGLLALKDIDSFSSPLSEYDLDIIPRYVKRSASPTAADPPVLKAIA